jgi:N-acetylmuramic acid 6-phosphate etherase
MNYSRLLTERRNPKTLNLCKMTVPEIIDVINREDAHTIYAVKNQKNNIARAVRLITSSLKNGGRLIFAGAGTSGRLGIIESAECSPTFNTPLKMIRAIIAGGRKAVFRSIEGAEDNVKDAKKQIHKLKLRHNDVLVGISASKATPFVKTALKEARLGGAGTILITSNRVKNRRRIADVVITLLVGPEVITGSTRMKAGTATKMVLNILTTVSMIQLGKVYQNLMVDLQPKSKKLYDRALRIIMTVTGVSRHNAKQLLKSANNKVKIAILMAKKRLTYKEALKHLSKHNGLLRKPLE